MENLPAENIFLNRAHETMNWEKRRERLDRRFAATIAHAYGQSNAYREMFDAAGIDVLNIRGLDELETLPILRMADLAARQRKAPPFGGFNTVNPEVLQRIYVNPDLSCSRANDNTRTRHGPKRFAAPGFAPETGSSIPSIIISGPLRSCWMNP